MLAQVVRPAGVPRDGAAWFRHVWPRTQQPGWAAAQPLNAVQRPGEVIFVPAGWWHAVLNLDLCVAVTHNFCSSSNFPEVWRRTVRGRPKLSAQWLTNLRTVRPPASPAALRPPACCHCHALPCVLMPLREENAARPPLCGAVSAGLA